MNFVCKNTSTDREIRRHVATEFPPLPDVINCRFPAVAGAGSHPACDESMPTIDHRGPEFAKLGFKVLADLKIFKTEHPVIIYPASGTGAGRQRCATCCRRVIRC